MLSKVCVLRLLLAASVLSIGATSIAIAQIVPQPSVSWTSASDYVVSYTPCVQCPGHGIEEFQQDSGHWLYVGEGPQTFANRAEGVYRYRTVYAIETTPFTIDVVYSAELSVVVSDTAASGLPATETPPLAAQLDAEFQVLAGYLAGDAHRDLLVRRLGSGPDWGPEAIDAVLLRQDSTGAFGVSVPTPSELALAESWGPAEIELRKRDVNIDGFVDLVLRGFAQADGFAGVSNQILFAPGEAGSGQPVVRAVDGGLERFSGDMNLHLVDPDYFPDNAPYRYAVVVYYTLYCGWQDYYGYVDYYYPQMCFYEPSIYVVTYQDYSGFDQDAIEIAKADYAMIHGYESAAQGMQTIATTIETLLDVQLGQGKTDSLLGTEITQTTAEVRRGIALFSTLAGISEAVAQEADDGAGQAAATERVLLKGRRVLGQGPFHTALEFRYSTISAYDSDPQPLIDGRLVSQVDWPRDHPSLTLRLGYVDGPQGPVTYWQSLLAADGRYDDDLRYDLFPSLGQGGYNSNSYVSGLIQATAGLSTVQMSSFVGGERPVPVSEFN